MVTNYHWKCVSERLMHWFAFKHFDDDGICQLSHEELQKWPTLYRAMVWRGHAKFAHWLGSTRFILIGRMYDFRLAIYWRQKFNMEMRTFIPKRHYGS